MNTVALMVVCRIEWQVRFLRLVIDISIIIIIITLLLLSVKLVLPWPDNGRVK
jgi:hypothetical protein